MTYNLDVENFILEVKRHPELWGTYSADAKNITKRQAAWKEIAQSFIPDFEEMTDTDRTDVYKKLQGKWRNLRDSYVRYARGRPERKKSYSYAKHLSFLEERYSRKKNDAEQDSYWSDNNSNNDSQELVQEIEWHIDDEDNVRSVKRKKGPSVVEYVETNTDPFFSTQDEDKSFFDSLLPAVRDFNLDQKLEFRSEVIKLVKNIRKGILVTKTEPHSPQMIL